MYGKYTAQKARRVVWGKAFAKKVPKMTYIEKKALRIKDLQPILNDYGYVLKLRKSLI